VDAAELLSEAVTWAREFAAGSPTALSLGKKIINTSFEQSAQQIFELGRQAQAICYTSAEHREAVSAFLAKSAART